MRISGVLGRSDLSLVPVPVGGPLRDSKGYFLPVDALTRFAAKCTFDAHTGCVLWTGGKTRGRGNSATYGSFWDRGRREFAHRWAATFIHGFDLSGGETVGHCCQPEPNTLCVEHLEPQTLSANVIEGNVRRAARARQTDDQRKFWLLVDRGYEQLPPAPEGITSSDIPFHEPPAWLRPFMAAPALEGCPF